MALAPLTIIGAGAWGTALAVACSRNPAPVHLYTRNISVLESIKASRENTRYLPGITLPRTIQALPLALLSPDTQAILLAVPAQHLRSTCLELRASNIATSIPFVICCKGIEENTLALMHEVVREMFPTSPIAILSGPNFADEIARGLPAATTLACEDQSVAQTLTQAIGSSHFRPYVSQDIIGSEIGGAVKNVLAIACGIAHGQGFGENAKAALITRGLAEMQRLCVAKGGNPLSLMGLSGIGDIVLTCSSLKSRNMSLGVQLGEGKSLATILAERITVAEGVHTAKSVTALAKKLALSMPICEAVYRILYENAAVSDTVTQLLERPFSTE